MKHKNQVMWGIILAVLLLPLAASVASGATKPSKEKAPPHLQKAMINPADDPQLPNVLIMGCSLFA
jgi:hypothetical protein